MMEGFGVGALARPIGRAKFLMKLPKTSWEIVREIVDFFSREKKMTITRRDAN